MLKKLLLLTSIALCSNAFAGTNISYLRGNNYELGSNYATTLVFENGSGWKYGDNYFFFDVTKPFSSGTFIYGEWHSRLSLSKMTGEKIQWGPISDVLLAGEVNFNGVGRRAYLMGLGTNLIIPTFTRAKLNLYARRDPSQPGTTYQLSFSWAEPINISPRIGLLFTGFADYAGKQGTIRQNFLAKPRILLDLGRAFDWQAKTIYAGLQYVYWKNKLGNYGVNENAIELRVSWAIN